MMQVQNMAVPTYKMYINGKWVSGSTGKTFVSKNPANEKVLGKFQLGNEKDVKKAIDAARRAYPKWSKMPPPKRGEILLKIAELLKKENVRVVVQPGGQKAASAGRFGLCESPWLPGHGSLSGVSEDPKPGNHLHANGQPTCGTAYFYQFAALLLAAQCLVLAWAFTSTGSTP